MALLTDQAANLGSIQAWLRAESKRVTAELIKGGALQGELQGTSPRNKMLS